MRGGSTSKGFGFAAMIAALAALAACAQFNRAGNGPLCADLGETECLRSAACTLVAAGEVGDYRCRVAADHCESMFRQLGSTAAGCVSRANCRYLPGRCYCAPGRTCVCGGGPPPACRPDLTAAEQTGQNAGEAGPR